MRAQDLLKTVASRWFLGSVLLGSFGLLVNATIISLSKADTPLSSLVSDGGILAAALTVQLEWLVAVWYGAEGAVRNRLILTDGAMVAVLMVCFALMRVDVLTPTLEIFDQGKVAWLSGCAVVLAVATTATTAALLQLPRKESLD